MRIEKLHLTALVALSGMLAGLDTPVHAEQSPICTERLVRVADEIISIAELVTEPANIQEQVIRHDFDGDAIIAMVRKEVAYEPYAGTLKGSRGTLSARSGNALDQSLLLAHLLKDAGFDARIARAELDDAGAVRLAGAALSRNVHPELSSQPDALERKLDELASRAGRDSFPVHAQPDAEGALDPRVEDISRRLARLASLHDRSVELLGDLKDYFWVQWRIGPGDPWLDAHPAFGMGGPPENLIASEYFSDAIPEELHHRVRFEMGIERLQQGKLHVQLVAAPWERPAANFFDHAITVGVMPMGTSDPDRPAGQFVPIFNGQLAPAGKMFNLQGQVIDLDAGSSAAAGVFENVGKGFLSAAESLADSPDEQPLMALTGQFVRVTWTRPDGRKRTEERWLLDRVSNRDAEGADPRIDLSLDAAMIESRLTYQRTYLVQPPGEHTLWSLRSSLEAGVSKLRFAAAILDMQDWESGRLVVQPGRLPTLSAHEPLLLKLSSAVHQPPALESNKITWRDGPFIAALHLPLTHEPEPAWLDIQVNPWRGATVSDSTIEDWPEGALTRGVLDTAWEGAIVGQPDAYIDVPAGQVDLIETASGAAQRRDRSEGFLIAGIGSGRGEDARWWRIHPETGEVLGMRELGGAVTAEYVVGVVMVGIGGLLLVRSAYNCSVIENKAKRNCCYAVAAAFGISGGAGLGAAALASPLGLSLGASLLMGATQLKAMVLIDQAQSIATDAACN